MGNVERAEIRSGFEDGEDDRATLRRAMSTSACIPSRNDRAGGARARSGLVIAPGPVQQMTTPHAARPLLHVHVQILVHVFTASSSSYAWPLDVLSCPACRELRVHSTQSSSS